ncbi:MAG: isocitrate dehydrogenase kinase/phosphatase [Saprospiraceae bacterium]|jgi:isocitrate dehydrogenase kinase/phosphatase
MSGQLAHSIAETILYGFDRHYVRFTKITAAAKYRFEKANWAGDGKARRERIDFYDTRVTETVEYLDNNYDLIRPEINLWQQVKLQYMGLLYEHRQPELAESFYNSVFCQLFDRSYYNNQHIFVRPGLSTEVIDMDTPIYESYYPSEETTSVLFKDILNSLKLKLPWQDKARDVELLFQHFKPFMPDKAVYGDSYQIHVVNHLFFRNKAAYLIGRFVSDMRTTGFIIPILQNRNKELFVDALITEQDALDIVFSFTRAYFMVSTQAPAALVTFLHSILPGKTRADLYTVIGFQKQGKTLFYRDFLHHLSHSSDEFVLAPGIEGMVMSVFTLPSFPYVFKVIKDKFAPPKDMDRATVKAQYQFVKNHDRVGRMADTLEFSHVSFPIKRLSEELLTRLKKVIDSSISIEGDRLIIRHLYIERRMVPLNLYVDTVNIEELEHVIADYGQSIKDMVRSNIFPGDMLLKNFGVTRQKRVVFYDYDEIVPLNEMRIRRIPLARTPEQEMATEPWYRVEKNDFFPEQFENFVISHPTIRKLFMKHHPDLIEPEYWKAVMEDIAENQRADIFPYDQSQRFIHQLTSISDECD